MTNAPIEFINKDPKWNYYQAKNNENSNFLAHLQIILESNNSYWNFRVASLCITEKRLPINDRPIYAVKHAEILFQNNDLEYIIRFLQKIANKPDYQEFLKSKPSISYYEEELKKQTEIKRINESKRQVELQQRSKFAKQNLSIYDDKSDEEKSKYILTLEEPELNYYAITNLNITIEQKKKHLKNILKSKNAYWNYKCIKLIINIKELSIEEKRELAIKHIKTVINSGDKKIIKKLNNLLYHKQQYKNFKPKTHKSKLRILKNNN